MRIVEVRTSRDAFADILGSIRIWLDRNSRPLVRFETETKVDTIVLKIEFGEDGLADTFAHDFAEVTGCRLVVS